MRGRKISPLSALHLMVLVLLCHCFVAIVGCESDSAPMVHSYSIQGWVKDRATDDYLQNVKVRYDRFVVHSDPSGYFYFPFVDSFSVPEINFVKEGYDTLTMSLDDGTRADGPYFHSINLFAVMTHTRAPLPRPPYALQSITDEQSIRLSWQAGQGGPTRDGFRLYKTTGNLAGAPDSIPPEFSSSPFQQIATKQTGTIYFKASDLDNGRTYSFLVVAYRDSDNAISRPSNIVSDTPRMGRADVQLQLIPGDNAFLDLGYLDPTHMNNGGSDIEAVVFSGPSGDRAGLIGVNGALIQDRGYAATWDEIDKAPIGRSSYPDFGTPIQVLEGHVIVILTGDNHYGKVWIRSLNQNNLGFRISVAYQVHEGSPEL